MRHARDGDLDRIDSLLQRLRALPGMIEKKPGTFYRKGRAFLHFHEDPAGMFADVRDASGNGFERLEVTGPEGQDRLVAIAQARLGA